MDFQLTSEQKMFQLEARKFAEKELIGANDAPLPKWRQLRKKEFPYDVHKKMVEKGYAGATLPEEYGGAGMDDLTFAIICIELCRGEAGAGLSAGATLSLAAQPILHAGNEEQKNYWLPRIAKGMVGAYAQTTPDHGSDVASIDTKGVIDGDWMTINGTKQFITNGSAAEVIVAIVKTENYENPHHNLTAVVIDADAAKKSGALIADKNKDFDKIGLHCSPTSTLIFENCRVPVSNILGPRGWGWKIAMGTLIGSRPMIAAQGVGIAEAALDCALRYVTERVQFGKKLAEFQAIQHDIAEIALMVEEARALTYQAAWLVANTPILERKSIMEKASYAKLRASHVAVEVALRSLWLHGGMGYMEESRISALVQDAIVLPIYEGASNIQKGIIAGQLLAKHGFKI